MKQNELPVFAQNLTRIRKEKGLTRKEAAAGMKIALPAYSRWENGLAMPDAPHLLALCEFLGIELRDLTGETSGDRTLPKAIYPSLDYGTFSYWNNYCCDLQTDYRQNLEEGKDVEWLKSLTDAIAALPSSLEEKTRMADALFDLFFHSAQKKDYPYVEPSDYDSIYEESRVKPLLNQEKKPASKSRLLGAIRGRFAGCMLGKTVEGIRTEELIPFLKETGNYPLHRYILRTDLTDEICSKYNFPFRNVRYADDQPYMPNDDDTNYVIIAQQTVNRFGRDFKPEEIAQQWIDCQPQNAYCTAERVAYRNYLKGYRPPFTATYQNPYREWIGAQIRADYWGYINPNDPVTAAKMAFRDASISHIKNGIYGEMYFAAVIAAAASKRSLRKVLDIGLLVIPPKSRFTEGILKVMKEYDSGISFEECMARVHTEFDEKNGHDWCHTISNAEIVVACLLYGGGDFERSVCMAVEQGFDTDCNGATVGSVLGMLKGESGVPAKWYGPFHDQLETTLTGLSRISFQDIVDGAVRHSQQK